MMRIQILTLLLCLTLSLNLALAQSPGGAKLAYDSGTLDKAKEMIDGAIQNEKHASKPKTWYYRGLIYAGIANDQTGLYTELDPDPVSKALEAYDKALALIESGEKGNKGEIEQAKTDMHPVIINFGVKKYQDDDVPAALDAFLKAQKTNPQDTIPFMYAADLAYAEERFEDFESSVQKVLEMDIKNKVRYYALYAFYLKDKKENKEKALEVAEAGVETQDKTLEPDTYKQLESLLLGLYIDLDRMDEAIAGVQKTIDNDPTNASNYFNLGVLYEKKGDEQEAVESYKKSIEIEPTYDALYNLGALYFNKGADIKKEADQMSLADYNQKGKAIEDKARVEFEKALPYFKQLYEMEPDNYRVLQPLAQLYNVLGQEDKAKEINKKLDAMGEGGEEEEGDSE